MSFDAYTTSGQGQNLFQPLPVLALRDPISTPSTDPKPDTANPNGGAYQIDQEWFNTSTKVFWKYAGQGLWIKVSGTGIGDVVDFGLPNPVTPIAPDANGRVNFTSTGGTVIISGVAGGLGAQDINFDVAAPTTLTFQAQNSAVNDGTAAPSGNKINFNSTSVDTNNISGFPGLQAAASGSTVTYELTNQIQGTLITNNATPTTILTFAFNTNAGPGTYLFDMDTIAYNLTDGLSATYSSKFCVRWDGVNGNLIAPPDQFNPEEGAMIATGVTYASTGSPVLTITALGIALKTIHWLTSGKYIYVS